MMLILQMRLKLLWVVCFLLFVCLVLLKLLSSHPLLCIQLVLLGGVFVSPMFCSGFTQQLQAPPAQLVGKSGVVKVKMIFYYFLLIYLKPQPGYANKPSLVHATEKIVPGAILSVKTTASNMPPK